MEVPDALAPTGRSHSVYRVDVSTHPLPPGGAAAFRDARLAALRTGGAPAGAASRLVRSFELAAGLPAAWYRASDVRPDLLAMDAVRAFGDHAFLTVREADAGKEPAAERLVRAIHAAYVPHATWGFCVGHGALVMDASLNESTRIVFASAAGDGLVLRLGMRTVREPDHDSYADLSEEEQQTRAAGGSLLVEHDGRRTAAGLAGREVRIVVSLAGAPRILRFTWHYPGTIRDARRPRVNLVATAPADGRAALETAWESVLGSLAPLSLRGD